VALKWPGDDVPVDLESATSVPECLTNSIVFAAAGRAYHIKLDPGANTIELIRSFDVPMIPKRR